MALNIYNKKDFSYAVFRGCFIKSFLFDMGDKLLKKIV